MRSATRRFTYRFQKKTAAGATTIIIAREIMLLNNTIFVLVGVRLKTTAGVEYVYFRIGIRIGSSISIKLSRIYKYAVPIAR